MYRHYEDPHKVQKMLDKAIAELEAAKADPECSDERLIDLYNEVESLKERLNFAWQDDEFEQEGE